MEYTVKVAACIYTRYYFEYGIQISESKLHSLMYFAQRESLRKYNELLFDTEFIGIRSGVYLKVLRPYFRFTSLIDWNSFILYEKISPILIHVFKYYSHKSDWSLIRLILGEYSYKKSREGLSEKSESTLNTDDIKFDADRITKRIQFIQDLRLIKLGERKQQKCTSDYTQI